MIAGRGADSRRKDPQGTAARPVTAPEQELKELRAAGAADYLTKPIDIERLIEVVTGDVALQAAG